MKLLLQNVLKHVPMHFLIDHHHQLMFLDAVQMVLMHQYNVKKVLYAGVQIVQVNLYHIQLLEMVNQIVERMVNQIQDVHHHVI